MSVLYPSKFETYLLDDEEQVIQETPYEKTQQTPEQTVFPEGFFSEL